MHFRSHYSENLHECPGLDEELCTRLEALELQLREKRVGTIIFEFDEYMYVLCMFLIYERNYVIEEDSNVKYDLLNPSARTRTARQLIRRANLLERDGNLKQAILDYQEGRM
jgi:hypothetical protein